MPDGTSITTITPTSNGVPNRFESINQFVRENVTGAFTEEENLRNETHVARFCDIFLRHLSPIERIEKAEYISSVMVSYLNWEKPQGRAQVQRWIGGQVMQVDRNDNAYEVVAHEGMHVLQSIETLPPNHSITYSINELISAQKGFIPVYSVDKDGFSAIKSEYKSKTANDYFNEILSGGKDLPRWFWGGWKLDLSDERYQDIDPRDKTLRDFKRFLEIEKEIESEILSRGEVSFNIMGVEDVYTTIVNVGTARGLRAFGVGHFTNGPKNAWTVLWLNSTGIEFEVAERMVIEKYLDGTLSDFDIKNPIEGQDFKRIKTGQEIYKTRKLGQAERPIPHYINTIKDKIQTYLRTMSRTYNKIPSSEISHRYSIFNEWLSHNKVKDTETSETFLVLDDEIETHMNYIQMESVEKNAEISGKIFAFKDKSGTLRKLSIPKTSIGNEYQTHPSEFQTVLPEEIGNFHTHIFFDSPASIMDLLIFLDMPNKFISITSTPNVNYVFVKNEETAVNQNELGILERINRKRILATEYIKRLENGELPGAVIIDMAKKAGLEVYIKRKPGRAEFNNPNLGIIQYKKF